MKKYLLCLVIFSTQILSAQNYFTKGTPEITSASPNHDFGQILEGQVVTHLFEIANKGTADLKIEKVRATCGCTAVQPAKTELKPGEKTTIQVEFDSNRRLGLQQKFVYVFSNDPKTPQYKLSFNAMVVEKLEPPKDAKVGKLVLEKKMIDFGNVEEGKVVEGTIGFTNKGNGVLEIINVRTSCGCTAAILSSRKLNPGEKGSLKIELDTSNREGKMTRIVSLFSNDPTQANQIITITANIEKRKS